MKHELKRKPDVQKTTMLAIVVNAVQIGVLFAFVLYVLTAGPEARNSWSLQFMVIAGALMAAWGAGVDIQDALRTRRLERTIGELQTTNEQMDALNLKLRAQRHDFLNHLQVVYSLLEMQEYGEATAYLERVYDEHRSVSSVLRTKMTAFNALLQVKSAACEEAAASRWRWTSAARWRACPCRRGNCAASSATSWTTPWTPWRTCPEDASAWPSRRTCAALPL